MKKIIDVRALVETGERQNRWLTYPMSRLVINPYCKVPTTLTTESAFNFVAVPNSVNQQVVTNNRPNMPLNIGVCTPLSNFGMGTYIDNALTIYHKDEKIIEEQKLNFENGWYFNVFEGSFGDYGVGNIIKTEKGMLFTDKEENYLEMSTMMKEFENNSSVFLDKTPFVRIKISGNTSKISIKIRQSGEGLVLGVPVTIAENIIGDGVFSFNIIEAIKGLAGWDKPNRRFMLCVSLYGQGEALVEEISFVNLETRLLEAKSYETSTYPHKLEFSAIYDEIKIDGLDFIYDENTIVRNIKSKVKEKLKITFCSTYQGKINYDYTNNLFYFNRGKLQYAMTFSSKIINIGFFRTAEDMILDRNRLSTPYVDGYLRFDLADENSEISAIISTKEYKQDYNNFIQKMKDILVKNNFENRIEEIADQYNEFLAKVPQPENFKIDRVPNTLGDNNPIANEEMVKEWYYRAWLFLHVDILPFNPETGFNYYQIACGKPSLWGYGDKYSPYSATWESLVAMQFYSYINVDIAMSAFSGMMTCVDLKTGLIEGESLPAIRGRTAWVIYLNSKDKQFLKDCYPAIKMSLIWAFENPQWKFGGIPSTVKESDFMWSDMVDLDFTRKIASEIGLIDEIEYWNKVEEEQLQNCKDWFFETPQTMPCGYYHIDINRRDYSHDFIEANGLLVNGMDSDYITSMYNGLNKVFNPNKFNCGFTSMKYPNNMLTWNGLIKHGYGEMALDYIQGSLRDVVIAMSFGEGISLDEQGRVYVHGVVPSIFNAAMMIDSVLMMNNINLVNGN